MRVKKEGRKVFPGLFPGRPENRTGRESKRKRGIYTLISVAITSAMHSAKAGVLPEEKP